MSIRPIVGLTRPVMQRTRVDLPEPEETHDHEDFTAIDAQADIANRGDELVVSQHLIGDGGALTLQDRMSVISIELP